MTTHSSPLRTTPMTTVLRGPLHRYRGCVTLAVAALAVLAWAAPALADPPTSRVLGQADIKVYGLGLSVQPARQVVPRDIATIVSAFLQAPTDPGAIPPFAADAEVRATLRGPSLQGPVELVAKPNTPFQIPALKIAGIHTLENIRLVSGGEVILYGSPESAVIEVIDKLLVTQVTARPLTAAEIREKGIVFDRSNFQAYNFTAAFAVGNGPAVPITFPVVLPTFGGTQDLNDPTATLGTISTQAQLRDLKTIIPDTLRIQTLVPNLSVVGFTLQAPKAVQGQQLVVPPIPGVIVIPGDIGFLNQYFSVMLMVGNVAPAGSNLVVRDVKATILLPTGADTVAGSGDDPLAMAQTAAGAAPGVKAVTQAGPDGALGTADDIVTIGPGETGNAEFLVEGRREGSHVIEMAIDATLDGLPVGPVTVQGRAAGMVNVRNPRFTLTFTHPDVVNAGESYTLDVTVTNTSESHANFVSLDLFPSNISGARLVGESSRSIEFIAAQDSATVSFTLISGVTGKVTAATLDGDGNVAGRFAFKTGVGELGVPLSPESLVLPAEANDLPKELRDAALGLLGRAWALATAPPAAVPKDLTRFSKQLVIDRAIDLAEAGLRVGMGEPLTDAVSTLWFDFAGSDFARIADGLQLPRDQELKGFIEQDYKGFDLLRRRSVRGDGLGAAFSSILAGRLADVGPTTFHQRLAEQATSRAPHVSVLVSGLSGAATPVDLVVVDPSGAALGGQERDDKLAKQIPFGEIAALKNTSGLVGAWLATVVTPQAPKYTVRLVRRPDAAPGARYTLSLVVPTATGLRRIAFENVGLDEVPSVTFPDGAPVTLEIVRVDGDAPVTGPSPTTAADGAVADPAPHVLGAKQLANADVAGCGEDGFQVPVGRVVAVLFSEEVTPESVQDRKPAADITAFVPEANRVLSVALQPSRRVAYVALRDPIGPFVDRGMTVTGAADRGGHAIGSESVPMQATVGELGGVLNGRVLTADGKPVPDATVRMLYEFDCGDGIATVGVSEKQTDADGRFGWDYVAMGPTVKLIAIDPETTLPRIVRVQVSRAAQRLNVDIVFVGRGTVRGRTLDESGAPLATTAVRVTSLTDNSQYGATSDATGAFTVPRVPVGNVLIEAVNVAARAQTVVNDLLPFAGATVARDLTLFGEKTPEGVTIRYGIATGKVLRDVSLSIAPGVTVFAYYQNRSQQGVRCPASSTGEPSECAVAAAVSGDDGAFRFERLPAGSYRMTAIDQGGLAEGETRFALPADSTRDFNIVLVGGLGIVRGTVVDASGAPAAGARVGGGLSLTTADAQGVFELTDVPVGRRTIVAVSDVLGARSSATIDVTRPGEIVDVRIVLPSTARITGVVFGPDGVTKVPGISVFAFRTAAGGAIEVGGEAVTDGNGGFAIANLAVDRWTLSAFRPDFSDGNIVPVTLRYNGESLKQDIRFRGAGGRVRGSVSAADGVTRLAARVGISGDRLVVAGGRVAVRFEYVQNFQIADTNAQTGEFGVDGLFVGPFTLRALGQFSPDPITFESAITSPNQEVRVDLKLQPTSRITGVLVLPDGATRAPANVQVTFKSNAVKVFCSESPSGETECTSVPQGIQQEVAVTNDRGEFTFPLVNAGPFTVTANEAATGRTAEVRGTVRAGETLPMSIRLVGVGTITVAVKGSNATTAIPGAKVEVRQTRHPFKTQTLTAGPDGVAVFTNYSEGEFAVSAIDLRDGSQGRAAGAITSDGQSAAVNVFLFDQAGSVEGRVLKTDGAPAANTQVVISRNGALVGFTLTDADGAFAETGIPLGAIAVEAFEPTTGARGRFTGALDVNGQALAANFTLDALGILRGTLVEARSLAPLKNWRVQLSQTTPSGRSVPALLTTTGVDGSFSFPGASVGSFQLTATNPDVVGSTSASGAIARAGQLVDVTLVATINRQVLGIVSGLVTLANGQPSTTAGVTLVPSSGGPRSTSVGADGRFRFTDVPLGRFTVDAVAQGTGGAGRAVSELLFENEEAQVVVALGGLGTLSGKVYRSDGVTAAAGVQVTLGGSPLLGCNPCTVGSAADGSFTFANTPVRVFTVTAEDTLTGLKGTVSDVLDAGASRTDLRVVLENTSAITGRVLTAGGAPASGIVAHLRSGARTLFVETAADGTFTFAAVPLGAFTLSLQDPIGPGLARRIGTLQTPLALGDIVLDETPPAVSSTTPGSGATGVDPAAAFVVVFSEPVDLGTVTAQNLTLSSAAGPVTGALTPGGDDRTFTFAPLSPLATETRYTLRVERVKDRVGREMAAPFTATFTTIDVTAPTLAEAVPPVNGTGVTGYTTVRLKFSEPIDPARFTGAPITLRRGAAVLEGRTAFLFGNTVIVFTPAHPLDDDTVYQVDVAPVFDLAGNSLAARSYQFQTTDRTPPVITIAPVGPATVIEGTTKEIAVSQGSADLAVIDFYVNDAPVAAVRSIPFVFAFKALPQYGAPGATLKISALATDTSGNRSRAFAETFVTVTPDVAPTAQITAPSAGLAVPNGQRVNVGVRGTDEVGVAEIAYRANTGNAADAAVRTISPSATDRTEAFGFDVPAGAAPGSTIAIEATVRDTKGQVTAAAPITISVLDAAPPTISITGASTGDRVRPGQTVSAIVVAEDAGRIKEIGFTASGAAGSTEVRPIAPPQSSVATSFTFKVADFAGPSDQVLLDAYAVDVAGNRRDAGRIVLSIADSVPPTITLAPVSGVPTMTPGRQVQVVAEATDETGVARITLTGRGAFAVSDAKSISPPLTSVSATFTLDVPATVANGATLELDARAIDLSGNASAPVHLTLTARQLSDVTLPTTTLLLAGERKTLAIVLGTPAPAGGLRVDLAAANGNVAVTPFVLFAAGESQKSFDVDGLVGGTSAISASINATERATMTATVVGGVVRGRVVSDTFEPVGGAQVTVFGGTTVPTVSAADGTFLVQGMTGPSVTVRVLDAATSRIGFAQASMNAANGFVNLADIVLVTAGTITGTVTRATPAGTPAGAGVQVQLFKRTNQSVGPLLATTFTDAQSAFSFSLVGLGDYFVEASEASTGNRGRAATAIPTSGAEVDVPVAFLGRGSVQGTVTTAGGSPVDNVDVTLQSSSQFGPAPQRTAKTANGGKYRFDNVFVGTVNVTAIDTVTNTSGGASGEITADGQVVTLNTSLQAVGSITGLVTRFGGTPAGPGVTVSLVGAGRSTTTDDAGRYRFDFVPLGSYDVLATESSTGSRGATVATVASNAQTVTADITFLGKGTLVVTVTDANDVVVGGASVTAAEQSQLGSGSGTTGADGRAVLNQLNQGTYTVTASANGLGGQVTGVAVSPGQQAAATVKLEATATITGTVFLPNGSSPAPAGTVYLRSNSNIFATRTITLTAGDNGVFTAAGLTLGSWDVFVHDANGRRRALARDVVLASNGQVVARTFRFIGLGTVTGTVTNPPPGGGAASVPVSVQSLTPELGGTYGTTTNAAGIYTIANVPVGDIVVTASNVAQQLIGEGTGKLQADGESITVNIGLQSSAVTLPLGTPLTDAYGQQYAVQRDGSLTLGLNSVFNAGSMKLDIVRDGTATRFTGASFGVYEDGRTEIGVTQNGIAGINVTRKVYVPANGYFERYVELLSNPSADPVTVDVRVTAQLTNFSGTGAVRPANTSSGDDVLDATDRWVVIDDATDVDPYVTGNFPAMVFVMAGEGGAVPVGAAQLTTQNNTVGYEWRQVTVPANGRVALVHFVSTETTRAAGIAAAERLSGLAPEALVAFSAAEAQQTANFVVPADLSSTIPALPAFGGSVAGFVFEGDGTTKTPFATSVRFKSDVAVFSRELAFSSSSVTGAFTMTSQAGRPIPLAPGQVRGVHPESSVSSPWLPVAMSPEAPSGTQDVVFTGTAMVEATLQRADGSVIPSGQITSATANLTFTQSNNVTYFKQKAANAQGVVRFYGVPPVGSNQRYTLQGNGAHSQGTGYSKPVDIVNPLLNAINRSTVVFDGPTIRGRILLASGAPYAGASVRITNSPNLAQISTFERTAVTDANGDFVSTDVMVNVITVAATRNTITINSGQFAALPGQNYTKNLQFPPSGSITLTAARVNGSFVAGTAYLQRPDNTVTSLTIPATGTSAGKVTFTGLNVGTYTVYADALSNAALRSSPQTVVIDTDGQVAASTVTFPPFGAVTGVYKSPNAAGTLRPNSCSIGYSTGGPYNFVCSTSTTSVYRVDGLPLNTPVTIRAYYPGLSSGAEFNEYAVGQLASDGATITRDVVHPARATVRVTAQGGGGQALSVKVHAKTRLDANFVYRGQTSATTGVLDVGSVPEGETQFQLRDANTDAVLASQSVTVAATDDGSILPLTIQLVLYSGTITGHVRLQDGTVDAPPWVTYVDIRRADTLEWLAAGYVMNNGAFSFPNVTVGSAGAIVRASWGEDQNVSAQTTVAFTASGQTRDVTLNVPLRLARIEGTVTTTSGTPLGGVSVRPKGGAPDYYDVLYWSVTDQNGAFSYPEDWYPAPTMRFGAMLPGMPEIVVDAPNENGVIHADLVVDAQSFDVTGVVTNGDGVVGVPDAWVRLLRTYDDGTPDEELARVQTDEEGIYTGTVVMPAGVRVAAATSFSPDGESSVAASESFVVAASQGTQTVDLTLPLTAVFGTVYADQARGLTVPDASVFVRAVDQQTTYYAKIISGGRYRAFGVPEGPVDVTAQAPSGLEASASGTLLAGTFSTELDLELPPSTDVQVVTLNGGQPAPADVVLLFGAGGQTRSLRGDTTVGPVFRTVPVGEAELQVHYTSGSYVRKSVTLGPRAADGSLFQIVVDLAQEPRTAVLVQLYDADRNAATGTVTVEALGGAGPLGQDVRSASTTAAGVATFTGMPPGRFVVWARSGGLAGKSIVDLPAGDQAAEVVLGTARTLPASFDTGVGLTYYFDTHGWLTSADGFNGYTFFRRLGDLYADNYYCCASVAGTTTLGSGGVEWTLGPTQQGLVEVTRRIYRPDVGLAGAMGDFVRFYDVLTNRNTTPVSVFVMLSSNYPYATYTQTTEPVSGTAPRWGVTQTPDGASGVVAEILGGGTIIPAAGWFDSGGPVSSYNVTIPPGESRGFLRFAAVRGRPLFTQTVNDVQQLQLSPPALLLEAISPAERLNIVNWSPLP